ncbi:MAG TPA: threonine synthase [Candidatus Thermoplasmatota archaeon]|nr:threonine synthase [Candidatus Thermoplasmatota archaeon]
MLTTVQQLACIQCTRTYPLTEIRYRCECSGLLEVRADWTWKPSDARGVWRYRSLLPHLDERAPVTLAEGGTPLLRSERLAAWAGVRELRVKVEGANPTGSFKDRGMTVGVTLARALGATSLACASTGNTSASLAAYGARAGMRPLVLVPKGKIAMGKMAQALAFGARVVEIDGDFDDGMRLVEELSSTGAVYLLNSLNPLRLEGQKTLMFEILEEHAPDRVLYPVGNGGNISAGHKALKEAHATGLSRAAPMLSGAQAVGAAPLARAWREKRAYEPQKGAETLATAIRIGAPVNAAKAERAVRETGGAFAIVSDEEILEAQKTLAATEGIFVEPASAAPLAGLRKLVAEGIASRSESVVLVATGNGLKDPDVVARFVAPAIRVPATLDALRGVL